MGNIQIKRVYQSLSSGGGIRLLVERLWPRGVKKVDLKLDAWLKDVAPSTDLRKWFSHDPAKWQEFQRRYRAELDRHPETWQPILDAARKSKTTLLFSSHDQAHNNAVVLKAYLEAKQQKPTRKSRRSAP
jgi:uncharacterized protein YeaO (DUF488 family)